MPKRAGPCECNDENTKDVKCCGCLDSYCWFKVLAWVNLVMIIFFMSLLFALMAAAHSIGNAIDEG